MTGPRLPATYWAKEPSALLRSLASTSDGLSATEAAARLRTYGPNELREQRTLSRMGVLLRQLRSPLLLLLVFAAAASALSAEWLDSAIVLAIVAATVGIGYSREYSARGGVGGVARARARAGPCRPRRPSGVGPDGRRRAWRRRAVVGRQPRPRRCASC